MVMQIMQPRPCWGFMVSLLHSCSHAHTLNLRFSQSQRSYHCPEGTQHSSLPRQRPMDSLSQGSVHEAPYSTSFWQAARILLKTHPKNHLRPCIDSNTSAWKIRLHGNGYCAIFGGSMSSMCHFCVDCPGARWFPQFTSDFASSATHGNGRGMLSRYRLVMKHDK